MAERITILPVRSLADAEREIEKLARRMEKLIAQPVFDPTAPPTGLAGGVLSGGYPNPGFAVDMATQAELNAAIAAETAARVTDVDAEEAARIAAITSEAAARTAADTSEATTRSTADTTEATARAAGDAAVQAFAIQRANHTGTQLAATLSDFNSAVRAQISAALAAGANITLTPSGSGGALVVTIDSTGGGGSALPKWSPHKPPASANALDVEFASSSSINAWPAGWTVSSSGDFPSAVFPATEPSRFSTQDTAGAWKGRYAACPAGDFNFAAFVQVHTDTNFSLGSIGIIPGTAVGAFGLGANAVQMYAGQHSTSGKAIYVENTSSFIANFQTNHIVESGVVIWVRRVGSNWYWGWSADGLLGPEAGPFTGYAPTNIEVCAYSTRGANAVTVFRWVRVVTGTGARQKWGGLL